MDFCDFSEECADKLDELCSSFEGEPISDNSKEQRNVEILAASMSKLAAYMRNYPASIAGRSGDGIAGILESYELAQKMFQRTNVGDIVPGAGNIQNYLNEIKPHIESFRQMNENINNYTNKVGKPGELDHAPREKEPSFEDCIMMHPGSTPTDELTSKFIWLSNKTGEMTLSGASAKEVEGNVYGRAYRRLLDEIEGASPDIQSSISLGLLDYRRSVYKNLTEEYNRIYEGMQGDEREKNRQTFSELSKSDIYLKNMQFNQLAQEMTGGVSAYLYSEVSDRGAKRNHNNPEEPAKGISYDMINGFDVAGRIISDMPSTLHRCGVDITRDTEMKNKCRDGVESGRTAPISECEEKMQDIYTGYLNAIQKDDSIAKNKELTEIMNKLGSHVNKSHGDEIFSDHTVREGYVNELDKLSTLTDAVMGNGRQKIDDILQGFGTSLEEIGQLADRRVGEVPSEKNCQKKKDDRQKKQESELEKAGIEEKNRKELESIRTDGSADEKRDLITINTVNKMFGSRDELKMNSQETLAAIKDPKFNEARKDLKKFRKLQTSDRLFKRIKDNDDRKAHFENLADEVQNLIKDDPMKIKTDEQIREYVSKNPERVLAGLHYEHVARESGRSDLKMDPAMEKQVKWIANRATFMSSPYYGAIKENISPEDLEQCRDSFCYNLDELKSIGHTTNSIRDRNLDLEAFIAVKSLEPQKEQPEREEIKEQKSAGAEQNEPEIKAEGLSEDLFGRGLQNKCEKMYRVLDAEDSPFIASSREFKNLKNELKKISRDKEAPDIEKSRRALRKVSKLAEDYMNKKDLGVGKKGRLSENGALRYGAVMDVFAEATTGLNEHEKYRNPEHPIEHKYETNRFTKLNCIDAQGARAEREFKKTKPKEMAKKSKTNKFRDKALNFVARKAVDALLGIGGLTGLFFEFAMLACDPNYEFSLMNMFGTDDFIDAVMTFFGGSDEKTAGKGDKSKQVASVEKKQVKLEPKKNVLGGIVDKVVNKASEWVAAKSSPEKKVELDNKVELANKGPAI